MLLLHFNDGVEDQLLLSPEALALFVNSLEVLVGYLGGLGLVLLHVRWWPIEIVPDPRGHIGVEWVFLFVSAVLFEQSHYHLVVGTFRVEFLLLFRAVAIVFLLCLPFDFINQHFVLTFILVFYIILIAEVDNEISGIFGCSELHLLFGSETALDSTDRAT